MLAENAAGAGASGRRTGPPPLAWIVGVTWVLLSAALLLRYSGEVRDLQFNGPDDYLRLVQTTQWLDGAGWYDVSQPRMHPPEGVDMHWSRLPDIPLAAVIALTEPAVGRDAGMVLAATVVPLSLLLAMLLVAGWAATPIVGERNSAHAIIVAALLPGLLVSFAPGRVDHHGWQLILVGIALGALFRMLTGRGGVATPVTAGLVFALGLWIGAEIIPWLLIYCLALAALWIYRGGVLADSALWFAFALQLGTLALLPVSNPPSRWLLSACDEFSAFHVVASAAVLAFWSGARLVRRFSTSWQRRTLVATGLGSIIGGALIVAFPDCLAGPYSNVDADLAAVWLPNIVEIRSLFFYFSDRPAEIPFWISAPILGLAVAAWRATEARGLERSRWLVMLLFSFSGLALCCYQIRFIGYAQLFALIPLAWFVTWIWKLASEQAMGLRRQVMIFGPLLLVSPAPGFVIAELASDGADDAAPMSGCDMEPVYGVLNELPRGQRIAGFFNEGAQLLLRTDHEVLAANYHRNGRGNLTAYELFGATSDTDAQSIIGEEGIDLVLICADSPEMGFYRGRPSVTFAERLIGGPTPSWLEPTPLAPSTNYRLFGVRN